MNYLSQPVSFGKLIASNGTLLAAIIALYSRVTALETTDRSDKAIVKQIVVNMQRTNEVLTEIKVNQAVMMYQLNRNQELEDK